MTLLLHLDDVALTALGPPHRDDPRVEVDAIPQRKLVAVPPEVLDVLRQGDMVPLLGREAKVAKGGQLLRRDERRMLVGAVLERAADVGLGFEEGAPQAVLGERLERRQSSRTAYEGENVSICPVQMRRMSLYSERASAPPTMIESHSLPVDILERAWAWTACKAVESSLRRVSEAYASVRSEHRQGER